MVKSITVYICWGASFNHRDASFNHRDTSFNRQSLKSIFVLNKGQIVVKLSNLVNQYYLHVVDMAPGCAQTDVDGAWIDMVGAWTDICHRHGTQMHPDRCRWCKY